MAMVLHTGVPGAGKTYLLIKTFTDMFCRYDKDTERFELKEEHKDKVLISNIQGLTVQHLDLETMMNDRCETLARRRWLEDPKVAGLDQMQDVIDDFYHEYKSEKVRWFFDHDYQQALCEKHGPVIYLIEESQRYFDSKELGRQKWVRDVLYFFERHRHMGFSILCDTQHISKIHKGIAVLFETEVQARPRTMSVAGEFKYNEISDGCRTNGLPIVVKPDKRIFAVYKSMSHKEVIQPKKPIKKILIGVIVMVVMSAGVLKYAMATLGPDDVIAVQPDSEKVIAAGQVPPGQSTGSGRPGRPGAAVKTKSQEPVWIRLSYIMMDSKNINVIHPVNNAIVNLLEIDLPVRRVGDSIYADVSSYPEVIQKTSVFD